VAIYRLVAFTKGWDTHLVRHDIRKVLLAMNAGPQDVSRGRVTRAMNHKRKRIDLAQETRKGRRDPLHLDLLSLEDPKVEMWRRMVLEDPRGMIR